MSDISMGTNLCKVLKVINCILKSKFDVLETNEVTSDVVEFPRLNHEPYCCTVHELQRSERRDRQVSQ